MPSYTLNWSDGSLKPPFTLDSATADTSTTSLDLTGKNTGEWGQTLQRNMLRLLENFASHGIPPENPTSGQFWYNAFANKLYMYTTGNAWVVIWPSP